MDWNEANMSNEHHYDMDSMSGVDAQEMLPRNETWKSIEDTSTSLMTPSPSFRGSSKEALFSITKGDITKRDLFEQQRPNALSTFNDDGDVDKVSISGPKQMSVFDALSTAPQVGLSPIVNKKQADKLSKLLDI